MWALTMQPGKVLLGNMMTLTLTRTESVYCSSVPSKDCAMCIINTFFQHKRIQKNSWYRDSLGQRSLIDFCIVLADLFSTVSDVRVKRGAEL